MDGCGDEIYLSINISTYVRTYIIYIYVGMVVVVCIP